MNDRTQPDEDPFRLFLAGDALMIKPWSHITDPPFLGLIKEMRDADVTVLNLETLIHEFDGYAQADSGGAYMASPPEIANELKWAGVDMVSHANNHAYDYGPEGILATHRHCRSAGLVVAGTGENLQEARAVRTFQAGERAVALVSMASSFVPYGMASPARPDIRGRPGLNPLRVTKDTAITITRRQARIMSRLFAWHKRYRERFKQPIFRFMRKQFQVGDRFSVAAGRRAVESDLRANLALIREAAASADISIVAIHSHLQGPWLRKFAHRAIANGADIVFVHGPHEVLEIEIHNDRPIFYCLGDFVYQSDQIALLPPEAYRMAGLDETTATVADYHENDDWIPMRITRAVYEAVGAVVEFHGRDCTRIRLLPIDLQFDAPRGTRGRPQLADPDPGRRIIGKVAELSRKLGTRVTYDPQTNQGLIEVV